MLNEFLMSLSPEEGLRLYGALGNLQWPMYAAILLWVTVKYPIPKKQKLLLWVIFAAALWWSGLFCPLLNGLTEGMVPSPNMGVSFLFFCLITAVLAYAVKLPVLTALDALLPAYILGRGAAITGCVFYGCCEGFPCSFGIYSGRSGCTVFPTVPMDIILSVCITAYLMILTGRNRYAGNGRVTAMGLILFGILRLAIDLLRDNHKLVFLLTFEGFCGIAYIVAGALLLRKLRISALKK